MTSEPPQSGGPSRDGGISEDELLAEYVRSITVHQTRLRAYLIAMIRSESDADDLLQETNSVLWTKRGSYDRNKPFFPWACGIAYYEVLRSRRRLAKDRLWFDLSLLESITQDFAQQDVFLEERTSALRECIEKLSDEDRELLEARYMRDISPKELSALCGKPRKSLYTALARIRSALCRCIESTLALQRHP